MPSCKKCNKYFPNRISIDGKPRILNRRKYCLECSPFGEHNTKQIEKEETPTVGEIKCKVCGRCYVYDRSKGHKKDTCNSCSINSRRFSLKSKCIEYKGGKCSICDYDKCTRALEFHHIDPANKKFSISGCHCMSWEKIKEELSKCILVCSNCHREIESGITVIP